MLGCQTAWTQLAVVVAGSLPSAQQAPASSPSCSSQRLPSGVVHVSCAVGSYDVAVPSVHRQVMSQAAVENDSPVDDVIGEHEDEALCNKCITLRSMCAGFFHVTLMCFQKLVDCFG